MWVLKTGLFLCLQQPILELELLNFRCFHPEQLTKPDGIICIQCVCGATAHSKVITPRLVLISKDSFVMMRNYLEEKTHVLKVEGYALVFTRLCRLTAVGVVEDFPN